MHMTWKEVKINMQQKEIYKQLHKESACQMTERLTEKQLQLQCVPPRCARQVRIHFRNSVKKLKSKMMLVWTPMSHTFHLKGKGNDHYHGPMNATQAAFPLQDIHSW